MPAHIKGPLRPLACSPSPLLQTWTGATLSEPCSVSRASKDWSTSSQTCGRVAALELPSTGVRGYNVVVVCVGVCKWASMPHAFDLAAPGAVPGCGAAATSSGQLFRVSGTLLSSVDLAPCFSVRVSVLSSQTQSDDAWIEQLGNQVGESLVCRPHTPLLCEKLTRTFLQVAAQPLDGPPFGTHQQYWAGFWTKSCVLCRRVL